MKFKQMLVVPAWFTFVGCSGASATEDGTSPSVTSPFESTESRELRLGLTSWNLVPSHRHQTVTPAPDAGEPTAASGASMTDVDASPGQKASTPDAGTPPATSTSTAAIDASSAPGSTTTKSRDAAAAARSDLGAASEQAGLHASGGHVLDAAGNVVHIHGVNRSGSEFACVGGYGVFDGSTDAASIAAMKTWNINAVRVPLNEDCWLGINGVGSAYSGASYQSAIEGYVDQLLANGLYAIVDLHWSAPGTTLATGQQAMADADHAPAFWTSVATAFKGDGNVLLELFNEPWPANNQDTTAGWECWRDGGNCPGISYTVAGMQALVDTVRATGATNLVLLGGLEYSNALSQWATYKPADPLNNLAAAWHVYQGNVCSATTCFDQIEGPLLDSFPIVATEIGDSSCDGAFPTMVAGWLDGHDQGYTAWTWNTWGTACSNYSLITDYDGTPNGAYGASYQSYLRSL